MQAQSAEVRAKCAEVFAVAKQQWPHLDFANVGIRFDLKGRAAGMACMRGGRQFYMRFNADMLGREAFDHLLNETVPHEIAHIVCFMDPSLGRDHNSGWVRVSQRLGCSGKRYHSEEVVNGKGTTYEFVTDRGHKVRIGDKHFSYLQTGKPVTFKRGMGQITKCMAYSIVGYQGRTLPNPIPKQGSAVGMPVQFPSGPAVPRIVIGAPAPYVPHQPVAKAPSFDRGASKASIARSIMYSAHKAGKSYEEIISAIMFATGHDRNLSRAYYKNNAAKVGVPAA